MHKLLERQIRRLLADGKVPPALEPFVRAVDEAYQRADEDRALQERSLELASQELMEANGKLRLELAAAALVQAELEGQRREFVEITARSPLPTAIRRGNSYALVNQAWAASLGCAPDDLLGRSLFERMHAADIGPAAQALARIDAGEPGPPIVLRFKKPGEGLAELEVHAVRQLTFEGAPASLLGGVDITERKRLQARLMSADRMVSVGTLAAGVAHEINNPLSYVVGNLEYLAQELTARGLDTRDDFALALRDALDGALRVSRIVRDLKSFSRVEERAFQPVDVHAVLDAAANMARNEIRHRAILEKSYGRVPLVLGDDGKLGQVFINILVNAAQAMPEGAAHLNTIRISTRSGADGQALIEIADTGMGIPAEIRNRIFDPFFTSKPVGVGTGLGLYICQGIVNAHHGELSLESEVGRGTTFRITLPAAGAALRADGAEGGGSRRALHRRVLVVDDEPAVGAFVRRALDKEHDVVAVAEPREALARCAAGEPFDVILCDVMMPAMTGPDLHRELQRARPELAATMIFMSGGVFSPGASHQLDGLANRRLEKPLDLQLLREMLETR